MTHISTEFTVVFVTVTVASIFGVLIEFVCEYYIGKKEGAIAFLALLLIAGAVLLYLVVAKLTRERNAQIIPPVKKD